MRWFTQWDIQKLAKAAIVLGIFISVLSGVITWLGQGSAITGADKQAIDWLNRKGNSTFSTSEGVAPWIYTEYVSMEYRREGADYVVWRSKPMTPRTDPKNAFYDKSGGVSVEGMQVLADFNDGKVEVRVYGRGY